MPRPEYLSVPAANLTTSAVQEPAPHAEANLSGRALLPTFEPPHPEENRLEEQAETSPGWQASWPASTLLYFWLAGTTLMAILQLLRIVRFRRLLACGKRAPRCLVRQVEELAGKLKVRAPVTRLVARISSPFVWGIGRAKLLWPSPLMSSLPSRCRPSVIAHELAHLRRRDHWVSWLEILAECVWWWNPVYWYVRRQLRLNAELACDAWVIETLPEDRRAYAEALIEVTQHVSQTAAPLPALGMNGSARQVFERRLTMIMRDRVPHRLPRAGLLAAGLLAMLAIPGWSQNGPPAQKGENPPRKEKKDLQIYPAEQFKLSELTVNPDVKLDAVKLVPAGDLTIMLDELTELNSAKSVSDADKRLQALEQQLQALLKEVQALRQSTKPSAGELKRWNVEVRPIQMQPYQLKLNAAPAKPVIKGTWVQVKLADVQKVVTLARTTYKLPHDKAEILAAFLREHVKANVETKVEGDNLTITTTPETQKAVDNLIGLIQGKPTAAKEKKDGAARVLSNVIDPELQLQDHNKVRDARFKLLMDAMRKDEADKGGGQKRNKPKQ